MGKVNIKLSAVKVTFLLLGYYLWNKKETSIRNLYMKFFISLTLQSKINYCIINLIYLTLQGVDLNFEKWTSVGVDLNFWLVLGYTFRQDNTLIVVLQVLILACQRLSRQMWQPASNYYWFYSEMFRQTMALNPMAELGYSNPIYPFMLLFEYRILVSQKC
jgi:hypothetical protein